MYALGDCATVDQRKIMVMFYIVYIATYERETRYILPFFKFMDEELIYKNSSDFFLYRSF